MSRLRRPVDFGMAVLACLFAFAAPAAAQFRSPVGINFDDMNPGAGPRHFSCTLSGFGTEPKWVIEQDRIKSKVLAQRGVDKVRDRAPICLYDQLRARNVDISVVFKIVSGELDPAAGVLVRAIDSRNYYVVRAGTKPGRVALIRVVSGSETEILAAPAPVSFEKWHKLRLKIERDRFFVLLDDKALFDVVEDSHNLPGRVGLWTRADSQVLFDDMIVAAGRDE